MQLISSVKARHNLAAALPIPAAQQRNRSRRAVFLRWLRKTHLYLGLWGALLGLLFGATGILMNHRAILKIPIEKAVQSTAHLPLPERTFEKPQELATWLQDELKFTPAQTPIVKSQAQKKIVWADREVIQPERWTVSLQGPQRGVNAEYFVGNRFVKLDQTDATPIGTLMRLHTAIGVSTFWVLLSDTIAGCLILLSITGLLLWTQLHTMRTTGVMASIGAFLVSIWFTWAL